MLLQMNIKNFALIEGLSLNFEEGFNVLTGETGAGKSILIDAINYVLGSKFNKDLIRTGESSTYVEAVFSLDNDNTKNILRKMEIEFDDVVIISRESFSSGRSNIKVNGKSVILSTLREITETLIDIHGQHENVNLLNSSTHIHYLDGYSGSALHQLMVEYKEYYQRLSEINTKIESLKGKDEQSAKVASYLQFQLQEIEAAKLRRGEDVELEERAEVLTNAEKISSVLNYSYELLYNGMEGSTSVYDGLDNVIKELRSIQDKVKIAKKIGDSLEEAYFNIEQNIGELRSVKDSYYYDLDELSEVNSRIYEIGKLKKKYGNTIEQILTYRDKLQKDLEEIINKDEIVNKLLEEKKKIEKKCMDLAEELHCVRNEYASVLEEKIKEQLSDIGMAKSVFRVQVDKDNVLRNNGFDKVQFLISTNPGEPLKPLEKIASGGELSRIMLSLKTVFINRDMIPTVIFDEIDTGISGAIAQKVAEKMYLISCKHQVFCITHLPQIATMSDSHYRVYKEVIEDKTYTNVKRLSKEEKIEEISRMIGGIEVTNITVNNSKQLIQMADKLKKTICESIKV
ncbi:DNA repair protein RecN [Clostridium thermarum]|uniref:DNA repair protein RecN n=1 Tax=Clostridium thermarum TaxID=1716543 RepID=UPI0013D34B1A|nr:DNA repair protein RecN [Clostridium thermarum]